MASVNHGRSIVTVMPDKSVRELLIYENQAPETDVAYNRLIEAVGEGVYQIRQSAHKQTTWILERTEATNP